MKKSNTLEWTRCLEMGGKTVAMPKLKPGTDFVVVKNGGELKALPAKDALLKKALGGFHVDLGGRARVNSLWTQQRRPICEDPRGMALVQGKFWEDIYLMARDGSSRAGEAIADGYQNLPYGCENLNWATAKEILAKRGKQLLSREEFAIAAQGVEQGKVAPGKQKLTGRIEGLTSIHGLEQATGTLWIWSRDTYNEQYPYILGGSCHDAGDAGPRCVYYFYPGSSLYSVGARGRCDHLILD